MIALKTTHEWSGEHREEQVTGSVRLYVGQLFCGIAEPIRGNIENYNFHSAHDFISLGISDSSKTLDDIKTELELTLKEFASKFCYTKIFKK